MHLRVSSTKRNGKSYDYIQLVESVRRPSDGMPTTKVIASLGALSDVEIHNLRAALQASRDKRRVVVAPVAQKPVAPRDVLANLRYLDLAVLLELWREWGLPEILDGLMPVGEASVPASSVVAALVLQRLVDPDSKLAATEWFPRSALPELLDVAPASFNNSRLHRVLDELDAIGDDLMAKLPRRYEEKEGAFASLFLDVSDAAFVGHGPSIAARAKTKEGFVARKIGIVLLCNQRGYPLRWEVVSGSAHDSKTMLAMLESISGLRWVGDAPVVCDRAMGKSATIASMSRLGLRFLTALTVTEFGSYSGDRLPHRTLAGLNPSSACDAKVEAEAVRLVTAAGMEQIDDNQFVMDLGVVEREQEESLPVAQAATVTQAMKLCRQMLDLVASKELPSLEDARRKLGLHKGVAAKYRQLQHLSQDIQRAVLDGRAEACTLDDLIALARLRLDQQPERFAQLLAAPRRHRPTLRTPTAEATPTTGEPLKLRVVAYFNQECFVEKRYRANANLAEIQAFVVDLNARLVRSGGRRSSASIQAEVDRKLRAHDLLGAFQLEVHHEQLADRTFYRVDLTLDEADWERRRRYDGFTILVAHPDLPHTPAQLCRLYRAKDVVEKDFHIIKSVVEIRPVWHHSDAKVRAHVTLCMLALLIERTLGHRLRGAHSAEHALNLLEPCRLNQFGYEEHIAYGLTRPTLEQKDILRRLGLTKLVDDEEVSERIHPR